MYNILQIMNKEYLQYQNNSRENTTMSVEEKQITAEDNTLSLSFINLVIHY